jgi:FdrA protein
MTDTDTDLVRRARVFPDSYRDSVELMGIAAEIEEHSGVQRAGLLMGTPANRDVLRDAGLLVGDAEHATHADLVVVIAAVDAETADEALALAERRLEGHRRARTSDADADGGAVAPTSIADALNDHDDAVLAMISTPGEYATAEAWKALKRGLHVFLFSDNVPIEDEVQLKRAAVDRDLLLMGPDCGTAIIDGIPLGFANVVAAGRVGIVGASGTGLQEVSCLLSRAGAGVSQAIGVGGRDLSAEVGGLMMRAGLKRLASDDSTDVIVCISKPPAPAVAASLLDDARTAGKPVIVCFLGGDTDQTDDGAIVFAPTLEAAAARALQALGHDRAAAQEVVPPRPQLQAEQVRIRGLFCGGTLATEARIVLETGQADDARTQWEITDLGADDYTQGRPHPMIEPRLRNAFVEEAALDPTVAVVLLDVVLGHGSHADPAGVLCTAVEAARRHAAGEGREIAVVASVCGTDDDPQGFTQQVQTLIDAGVVVAASNAQAARCAAQIVQQ